MSEASNIEIDRESLLVRVDSDVRIADVERALANVELTLDIATDKTSSVGAWLEAGAPGARSAWLDPADHLVAGFVARVRSTEASFEIRPAPRRAVGPDLLSLVLGLRGRLLALDSVWLRVHRKDAPRPTTEDFTDDTEPLTRDEIALFDAIERELR